MIVGITGPKLSGKGTTAAYLRETHGAVVYSMSGKLFAMVELLHLPATRENLIKLVTGLRDQFGSTVLAHALSKDILAANEPLAVIDGIRLPSEVDQFSALPGFQLWYIDAPIELRHQRAQLRGEKVGEQDLTFAQFQAEEAAVTERNIASLKERAVVVLENSGSLAGLHAGIGPHYQPTAP